MNSFDKFGFHALNQWAGHIPLLDRIMAFTAQYALEIYFVLFVLAWFTLPKPEVGKRHALLIMGLSGVFALLVNLVLSHIWFRPRPFAVLSHGTFTQLIPHPADASFPSDHVSGSFGFAAASYKKSALWVQTSFTFLAILVGIARIYSGVHWPTDVLAGLVIGIISSRLMWHAGAKLQPLTNLALRLFGFGPFAPTAQPRG